MGTYAPESATTPLILGAADCVAFVSVKFTMPNGDRLKPRHGVFVAFRGVGTGPAERLAAADRFGGVLYGKGATGLRGAIAEQIEALDEFAKDITWETGEVLIPRDVAAAIARGDADRCVCGATLNSTQCRLNAHLRGPRLA